jgi:hypothetical protein
MLLKVEKLIAPNKNTQQLYEFNNEYKTNGSVRYNTKHKGKSCDNLVLEQANEFTSLGQHISH